MFLACSAEMLPTPWLKTLRLLVLMGSDSVRLVMFTTGRFPFKYGRFVYMACREVVFGYLTLTGQEVLPDKTVTV